jgi:hypothetical protein
VTTASASGPVGATSPGTLSIASAYHARQRAQLGTSTPRASVIGLPTSSASISASSSRCSSTSAAKRSSTRLRSDGSASAQGSNARRAARTA